MQLIDVGLTVDTDGLDEKLDEINERLARLESDDDLNARVERAIQNTDVLDRSDVEDIFRDMAHSEGEDFVIRTISDQGYVTDDDVDQKLRDLDLPDENRVSSMIDDALDSADLVDADDVRRILADEGLDSDSVADAEEVETLKRDVADLARRFESYANKTDSIIKLNERLDRLERATDSANLEQRIATLEGSNETAVTFFGLIQKAFDLLLAGRRGS